ncbi:MAG TPA: OmpA family protein [Stellaceae bacterium]|nr:OmpA family protein [Stellaceae bacterium]
MIASAAKRALAMAALILSLAALGAVPGRADVEAPLGSVAFPPESTALPPAAQPLLDGVAARLAAHHNLRVELQGFAGGSDREARAQRLSLARALALRRYLMSRGIPRVRIIVRALGNRNTGGDADRVDVFPLS